MMKNFISSKGAINNLIILVIIVAGISILGTLAYSNPGFFNFETKQDENVLSADEVSKKVITFINEKILEGQATASLVNIVAEGELYKISFKIAEEEYESYVTRDGKLLFPQVINIEEEEEEIVKTEKPDVKLFVMSYCPFGLQAMKMYLPVYDLLKNKVEMGIYFVNYAMHGKEEIDENLRQYCVQKENKDQFSDYLKCFVEDGNSEKCLGEANIDITKLSFCVSQTDSQYKITEQYNDQTTWLNGYYPKFDVDEELNNEYEVQGSPTVVINGKAVNINPRSPEKFKEVICQTFASAPEECLQTLSGEASSTGFGQGTGSSGGGECK